LIINRIEIELNFCRCLLRESRPLGSQTWPKRKKGIRRHS